MSSDDLLQQLTAADSASPPPPGSPITTARLTARLKRRRGRALATSAAVILLGIGMSTLLSQPKPHTDDPVQSSVDLDSEIAQLADRIERLLGDLDAPLPEVHAGHKQLRFELATARANGLLAFQSNATNTTPKEIR